ncbi:NAD(P)H-dependent oxidoreductase [Staphylococcus agnetis]|uniref:NAD(P)H-dependent oxidoreductase n=1 Tax=Staphylococcus agnetis TaxID=985762 RepID=UPI00208F0C7F|nr:NAD(P)H-dependent oxidoreductase [Staphylococcus agnetis]MCO4338580.1 NAD(P)H-dependent oxidoreductase [Staphylococcus agnetis]MCO4340196.1 NAD(P)H-dependent oxidoreductase [Staphylococcus agnetis]MCO4343782.1 NAD(P)H-dependent oxidoreductase [Staphylococcus agnetis]MCO4345532.1 NAD(P)H-dependent oxidoreductase [Staphylococcus agnetis]MCO4347160.1 NAD(P)H-dependent oxidoreductase [Staphylococcus agnetis]
MKDVQQRVLDAYHFRHAIRQFDSVKKISEDDMHTILETGRLSPSSLGLEPWKFLVIQNKDLREALKPYCWGAQKQLDTASHFILILARKNVRPQNDYVRHMLEVIHQMSPEMAQQKLDATSKFQNESNDLYQNERTLLDWAGKQTYIPLGNMMTTAAMLGIDSCPMEGFLYEEVAQLLRDKGYIHTDDYYPSVMVAFGYRLDDPTRKKTRRPFNDVVQWIE